MRSTALCLPVVSPDLICPGRKINISYMNFKLGGNILLTKKAMILKPYDVCAYMTMTMTMPYISHLRLVTVE